MESLASPRKLSGLRCSLDLLEMTAFANKMPEKILLVLSTFPDAEIARRISNQLVSERLAACANIFPSVESIYRWKEKIESGNETFVFFKVSEDRQSAFQDKLRSLHPYDVPEIIFVPVASGLLEYLQWVAENCAGQARD